MPIPLDAVYTERFLRELQEFESDAKRADEFIHGAEWTLVRNPEAGTRNTPDSSVWSLPMDERPNSPFVRLYYTFDSRRVIFLSIKITYL